MSVKSTVSINTQFRFKLNILGKEAGGAVYSRGFNVFANILKVENCENDAGS